MTFWEITALLGLWTLSAISFELGRIRKCLTRGARLTNDREARP